MSFFEKHRKIILTVVITIIVFVIMGISTIPFKNSFFVTNIFNTVFTPIKGVVSGVSNGVGGFVNYLFEMNSLNDKNDELAKEVARLQHDYKSIEDYKKENERLRELLNIKETNEEYKNSIAAEIIGWSSDNWYNYYTVNKGSSDGIVNKAVVICADGLVGQICEVGLNWSKIVTIIDSSASVGTRVVRSGDITIVGGDYEFERDGLCKMTFINKDAQIIIGDTIETSGLGENYPSGIPLGKVVDIVSDSAGSSQYALIEPYADFGDLKQVLILEK